jgi:hypothetical protein
VFGVSVKAALVDTEMAPAQTPADRLKARFYPEAALSGFSRVDGTVAFYEFEFREQYT